MSNRDQRDRITPGILLLVFTLVLWWGLKLDADASSAVTQYIRRPAASDAASDTGQTTTRSEFSVDEAEKNTQTSSRGFPEPEELPVFGDEALLPALFEALDDADCDLDDPFSRCQ